MNNLNHSTLHHLNIALYPFETGYAELFTTASNKYLHEDNGYRLSCNSLPHITLCQFKSASLDHAIQIFEQMNKEMIQGQFVEGSIRLNPSKVHRWVELTPCSEFREKLMSAHFLAINAINDPDNCLTKSQFYDPHMSLVRLSADLISEEVAKTELESLITSTPELLSHTSYHFVLGRSNANGELLEIIR